MVVGDGAVNLHVTPRVKRGGKRGIAARGQINVKNKPWNGSHYIDHVITFEVRTYFLDF